MSYDLCCVGHVTSDKVVTPYATVNMPGGTAFYFSKAVSLLPLQYLLVTAVADADRYLLQSLTSAGIQIQTVPTAHTLCFENIYGENSDHRTQRVSQQADAFGLKYLKEIQAGIVHLGPLLAEDIPGEIIMELSRSTKVSLDVQGLLRRVENENVIPTDWMQKKKLLPFIHVLKANEEEARVLTEEDNIYECARVLAAWGVKEVVITKGSAGSLIYADAEFHEIPAYRPCITTDATGCGDTYMAGYLYQRLKGNDIVHSGKFAAAMATRKIEVSGPFSGTEEEIWETVHESVI